MINDSERREIAARLARESQAWMETFPDSECDFSDAAAMMQDLCVFVGLERNALCSEVFQRLADIIDRPTATATMDYEAMEDGIPDCRIWTCNGCKGSFPVYRGFCPTYCPVCGTELRNGD